MHPFHHDHVKGNNFLTVVLSWCEKGGERWWNACHTDPDTGETQHRSLRNVAGRLMMMSFSMYGNMGWKHGVYPYEIKQGATVHTDTARRTKRHAKDLKLNKHQLPTPGKVRWSMQLHYALLPAMTYADFVACFD